jgi:hypothetical protein
VYHGSDRRLSHEHRTHIFYSIKLWKVFSRLLSGSFFLYIIHHPHSSTTVHSTPHSTISIQNSNSTLHPTLKLNVRTQYSELIYQPRALLFIMHMRLVLLTTAICAALSSARPQLVIPTSVPEFKNPGGWKRDVNYDNHKALQGEPSFRRIIIS